MMSAAAPKKGAPAATTNLSREQINEEIGKIDAEFAALNKDKSTQAAAANANRKRELQSRRTELVNKLGQIKK
jgi:hypothetical protein